MKKYIFAIGSILTLLNGATPPPSIIENHTIPRIRSSFDDCDAYIEKGQQLAKEETEKNFGSLGAAIALSNSQTLCLFPTEQTETLSLPAPAATLTQTIKSDGQPEGEEQLPLKEVSAEEENHQITGDIRERIEKLSTKITMLKKRHPKPIHAPDHNHSFSVEENIKQIKKMFKRQSPSGVEVAPVISPSATIKRDDFPKKKSPHHLLNINEKPLIPLRSTAGNPEENEADEDGLLTTFFKILTGDPYL